VVDTGNLREHKGRFLDDVDCLHKQKKLHTNLSVTRDTAITPMMMDKVKKSLAIFSG
jgi:hypothetical protein